jgi:hypothetical protein
MRSPPASASCTSPCRTPRLLPPPAARTIYELTEGGAEVGDIALALDRRDTRSLADTMSDVSFAHGPMVVLQQDNTSGVYKRSTKLTSLVTVGHF